jgi:folate-binding protein YgfZ
MAPAFFDLSVRAKLRVTGADRIRFLNGQTTNDVRKAGAEATQESCVLNAKGHLDAHLFLFAVPNDIWIDANRELRELLQIRLERYVIADDVTIEDVTDQFGLFHVLADSEPKISGAKFCFRSRRLGIDGWDLWVEAARAEAMKSALAADYRAMDESECEVLRIENGIPRWGRELTLEIIPPEANLAARAIDYEKGCYIGQEVISRMKMSGQTRQRLCGLISEKPLAPGMELRAGTKMVGRVSSAIFSERMNAHIALAMIKRGYTDIGTSLIALADGTEISVRVVTIPFGTLPPSSRAKARESVMKP